MRYMEWSYDQLLVCPVDYLPVIGEEAAREKRDRKERQMQQGARRPVR